MARSIFVVNATQVDAQGVYARLNGFPKTFDSDSYNGDTEKALRRAKSAFFDQCSKNYAVDGKMMQSVTLQMADGRLIMRESEGQPVDLPPEPEPEPNEPEEEPSPEPEGGE